MFHLLLSIAVAIFAVVLFLLLQRKLQSSNPASASQTGTVGRWISELITSAIMGALAGLLLNSLASRIVPEYWGPSDPWGVAGASAVGGMLSYCFGSSRRLMPNFLRHNWPAITIAVTAFAIGCAAIVLLSNMPPRVIVMATGPEGRHLP